MLCMFSPPISHYPFPSPARTVIVLQAKHEITLGGGVSRKNGALVRRDQARHAIPLAPQSYCAATPASLQLVCVAGLEALSPCSHTF